MSHAIPPTTCRAARTLPPRLGVALSLTLVAGVSDTEALAGGAETGWPSCGPFIRGDANSDGVVDVSDAVFVLLHLFGGLPVDPECADACDANDDEGVDLSDASSLLGYLFLAGARPPAPFPDPGTDEPCDGEDNDGDGTFDEGCPGNSRDPARYSPGLVFLVSDRRWEDVLTLVPAAAWGGTGPACARPAGLDLAGSVLGPPSRRSPPRGALRMSGGSAERAGEGGP